MTDNNPNNDVSACGKLDANTDRALKIFDSSDGFVMPHGGFVAGSLR